MYASPFTPEQVTAILQVKKNLPVEPKVRTITSRGGKPAREVDLEIDGPLPVGQGLTMEFRTNLQKGEVMIALKVILTARRKEMVCRYDIHDGVHHNPAWCSTQLVNSGSFHRHVFSVRAYTETGDWDRCAELIVQPKAPKPPQQWEKYLRDQFVTDLNVEFIDKEGAFVLFGNAN